MKYKYQLHTHTAPTSKCAHTTPKELAEALHQAGYAGCVVTNHFLHGNTGVSRELPWADFVAAYENDYLECKKEGEKYGLDIIFGIEEGVGEHNEILCYGVTPEMLYEHPELREGSTELWCSVMRSLGVLVIQAHPFRYLCRPIPAELVDGIEVYNNSHSPEYNTEAREYASAHPGIILTSGADTHSPSDVGYSGIEVDERIRDREDLIRVLREGRYQLLT